jgi:hypothetical protein
MTRRGISRCLAWSGRQTPATSRNVTSVCVAAVTEASMYPLLACCAVHRECAHDIRAGAAQFELEIMDRDAKLLRCFEDLSPPARCREPDL